MQKHNADTHNATKLQKSHNGNDNNPTTLTEINHGCIIVKVKKKYLLQLQYFFCLFSLIISKKVKESYDQEVKINKKSHLSE